MFHGALTDRDQINVERKKMTESATWENDKQVRHLR